MAIESIYWREEISRIAKTLKPKRRPLNWSERLVCTTEREIIVGFFILRKLVELKKVTDKTKNLMLEIQGCKPKTNVHFSNRFELEEYYDLNGENSYQRSAWYLSNSSIHTHPYWRGISQEIGVKYSFSPTTTEINLYGEFLFRR